MRGKQIEHQTLEGNMSYNFKFLKDEDGAVTVDYVVLCAAIVLVGATVAGSINTGLETKATTITGNISSGT